MNLTDLNNTTKDDFLALIGGPLEGEVWLAERLVKHRPFETVDALIDATRAIINDCTEEEKVRLIASHPDLAPKLDTKLSEASIREQASAGLDHLSEVDYQTFQHLNKTYKSQFGFPFVICARENTKSSILEKFAQRLDNTRPQEIEIATGEILKIIRLRVDDLL